MTCFLLCSLPVDIKMISDIQALVKARALVAGLELATERSPAYLENIPVVKRVHLAEVKSSKPEDRQLAFGSSAIVSWQDRNDVDQHSNHSHNLPNAACSFSNYTF
ncbi:hypothetical protein PoB_002733600 [Plakobranchus ocellatus]|uniref:Uncharacterized protein n=1 Tax=Plakobranchus ocellatus TaxID=259542 RepID=A0AAV3ZY50_9GAST|nr:hypothetical protein PoB_002733600 [Plakobranchus ocellatus]